MPVNEAIGSLSYSEVLLPMKSISFIKTVANESYHLVTIFYQAVKYGIFGRQATASV